MPLTKSPAPAAIDAPRTLRAVRRRPALSVSLILGVAALAVGCSDKKPEVPPESDAPAPKMASPAAPAKAEKKPEAQPQTPTPEPEPAPEEPSAKADSPKPEAQEPTKETPKAPVEKGLSSKAMMAKVKSLKVSDKAAMRYLEQSKEKPDSTPKDRALAANSRGEKLFAQPERAEAFFRWAQEHYPRHPLPAFNRAKIAAIRGEIDQVKAHLKTVKERRGRKLLGKVGFDPTFALVHDDPEVRSLIRSAR